MMGLLLGLPLHLSPPRPSNEQPKATAAFIQLHPDAAKGDMDRCQPYQFWVLMLDLLYSIRSIRRRG